MRQSLVLLGTAGAVGEPSAPLGCPLGTEELRACCCAREGHPPPCAASDREDCCNHAEQLCEATSATTTTTRWFCSHSLSWEECQEYLPSERVAMRDFLFALKESRAPPPGTFKGRGIVMSGGPAQLLQALANLHVLRQVIKSELPVEFWHAFELSDAHCELLAVQGAACRNLQMPGVYPHWQTTLPAIMSSSYKEVLWIDTDVTPLLKPERLFETKAFQQEGALFWPDLWGMGCSIWGQTAWDGHIAWHLLNMTHNASDVRCAHEHEAGHLLINRERHWKALSLANFLGTRNFFQKVIWGYKDVFRLAWLKLNASNWFSPVRPGLVGFALYKKQFQAMSLVHFWPDGDEMGAGVGGRPVPLYLHQKKIPGLVWRDVVTFEAPLGSCVNYRLAPFVPAHHGAELWDIERTQPDFADLLLLIDQVWNQVYGRAKEHLGQDPRESPKGLEQLDPKRDPHSNVEFLQVAKACKCDYADNRWFLLLSAASGGGRVELDECGPVIEPGLSAHDCPVGFAVLALLCSQRLLEAGDAPGSRAAVAALGRLLPEVSDCLPHSFWPVDLAELQAFVRGMGTGARVGQARAGLPASELVWRGGLEISRDQLAKFPRHYRRCVPVRDPQCWHFSSGPSQDSSFAPQRSCFYCCDRNLRVEAWHALCFDAVFSEERCCNPV